MPIYEYRCASCGTTHEVLQKISEAPPTACPTCHANALSKLVSAAGFQLKGSGWYATDFKGGGKKPADKDKKSDTKTEAEPESKTESKSESKTESKPEPKSESKAAA